MKHGTFAAQAVPQLPSGIFDPDTARLRGTIAGIAPYVILGTALSAVSNWTMMARQSPAVSEIGSYLVICGIAFVILAGLMWQGARAAKRDFTGLVGIVYLGLFATSCTIVANAIGGEIRFSLGYCAMIVIGAVFFWPRTWHFVAGTFAALCPPLLLVLATDDATGMRSGAILFVVNTTALAVFLYVMSQRSEVRSVRLAFEVAYRASHDGLTGVLNRAQWTDLARRQLNSAYDAGRPSTLLVIDVDGFKQVNDRLGHDAGDRILVTLGETLRSTAASTTIAGRLGGDEFVVLVPGGGIVDGESLARRIRFTFAESGGTGAVTLSIGTAEQMDGEPLEMLLIRADRRMYDDKRDNPRHDPIRAGRPDLRIVTPEPVSVSAARVVSAAYD
ncbi:MAG TPA: GGDEF domain-containing protein [Thermomicrobiales bacterium]|jgi:diguanylate cyclase (GGDEF)-like protein|nr:GGDEF domain-containing protein [Thermomicrobiales bacterium]